MGTVVWYLDFWHCLAFEILLTVAATCSAITLIIVAKLYKKVVNR